MLNKWTEKFWRSVKPKDGRPSKVGAFGRVAAVCAAGVLCGCGFQPLYGEHSAVNGPSVQAKMAGVDVLPIDAPNGTAASRMGVEVRNNLIFGLTQGAGKVPAGAATHTLVISLSGQATQVIIDTTTARPDVTNYGIDATYTLTDLNTRQIVVRGRAFSRVSYDIPGQQQRFAGSRAQRDAQDRASLVLSEAIKNRLASYFLSGA